MIEELLARISPGMNLCSSDYTAWGEVDGVCRPPAGGSQESVVSGRVKATGARVYVPASAVLELKGERCVRVDAPLAEVGTQGWERQPEFLARSL